MVHSLFRSLQRAYKGESYRLSRTKLISSSTSVEVVEVRGVGGLAQH